MPGRCACDTHHLAKPALLETVGIRSLLVLLAISDPPPAGTGPTFVQPLEIPM